MWTLQSNFTKGEIDPQLAGRTDSELYYQGVKTARNVQLIPQGGLRVRYGTLFIGQVEDGRMEKFIAENGNEYVLVFCDLKMYVYKNGVRQTNINASGLDYLVIPHTLAQVQVMDYIQAGDTFIITHEDVTPHKVLCAGDTTWTISTSFLTNIPQYDYNDGSSPAGTAEVQRITFSNATEGEQFKLMLYGILTSDIVYGGDSNTNERNTSARNMQEALQDHPLLKGKSVTVAWASGSAYDITLDQGLPYPVNLITATASLLVIGTALTSNTTQTTPGVSRAENVWSATRGWPRTCTFHEGRLYFGGSKSLPQTVWGSNVNDYFNFRSGRAFEDNAVTFTLATDNVNKIQSIYSNRTLQIFTTDYEFYVNQQPITPANVSAAVQTSVGSKRVRPVNVEGITVFINDTGRSINGFDYVEASQSNKSVSLSVLSPHLIKNPVQMVYRKATSTEDAAYVYLVNTDGTVTVVNSLSSENILAFTRWETDGLVKSVCAIGDDLYFLVKRVIGGLDYYFLEKESETVATDCAVRSSVSSDTLTGLGHIEGETVKVRALTATEVSNGYTGGSALGDEVVTSGAITVARTFDTIEAGLDYTVTIETMPVVISQFGNAFNKKRIKKAGLDLYQSVGVSVNGYEIPTRTIGIDQFGAPVPFTGKREVSLGGWSKDAKITITRNSPHIFQIINLGLEVKL